MSEDNKQIKARIIVLDSEFPKPKLGKLFKSIRGFFGLWGINQIENTYENECYSKELYLTLEYDKSNPLTHIKEGDYYIDDADIIRKAITSDSSYWGARNCYSKIVATTDNSKESKLNLPLINDSFVEDYVKSQGKINQVKVEIINNFMDGALEIFIENKHCIIHPVVERLYTKDEVINVAREAFYTLGTRDISFDDFLKEQNF